MNRLSRRSFLQDTLAAAASITIAGTKSSGRVLGANEAIRVGIAGIGGRGTGHINEFGSLKGVQLTYLIDPDSRHFAARLKQASKFGGTPKTVQDIRQALDDKNLDAITVATPNHWHALMTIWACQAGKDVYVEKPASHNVHEGRIAVDVARKYNRIVQHGTQNRSSDQWAHAAALIRSGKLGRLLVSRGLCYKIRNSISFKKPEPPPAELDFNIWVGPAAERPFHRNLVHYNWHWFWDFGNGDIGNQGVHEMDKARWMIPNATLPRTVFSLGGRFGYKDQGETANTQIAVFDYGETQLIFEVHGLETGDKKNPKIGSYRGETVGNVCHLEEGTIVGGNQTRGVKFYPKGSDKPEPLPRLDKPASRGPGRDHAENFIAAVRSRQQSDLNADILEGHLSAALIHYANASYRLGSEVPFDKQTKSLGDNKEVYETLTRTADHLKDNGVVLAGLQYRLGPTLSIDPKTEMAAGNSAANQLLTRTYRQPFAVPEKLS